MPLAVVPPFSVHTVAHDPDHCRQAESCRRLECRRCAPPPTMPRRGTRLKSLRMEGSAASPASVEFTTGRTQLRVQGLARRRKGKPISRSRSGSGRRPRFPARLQPGDASGHRRLFLLSAGRAACSIVDVKVPAGLKIGYIMGAGDDIPTVLRQLGLNVTCSRRKSGQRQLAALRHHRPRYPRLRHSRRCDARTTSACSITSRTAARCWCSTTPIPRSSTPAITRPIPPS